MINNRQNGRRRGRGGQQRVGGGNPGRPESGNRIDNRARGNASQLYEKYKALAGDAQRQGDRVNTEYYLQFADHYFRVLAESRPRFEEQQARTQGRDEFDDEFDGDGEEYGQEGEPARPDQYQPRGDDRYRQDGRQNQGQQDQGRQDQGRQDQPRQQQDRQSQGRQNQDRQDQDRSNNEDRARQPSRQDARSDDRPRRDDRPRQDRQDGRQDARPDQARADQSRPDQRPDQQRQDERPRQDRPRRDGAQDQRPREDRQFRAEQSPEQPVAETPADLDQAPVIAAEAITPPLPEMQEASTARAADMEAPLPRRRGRPPKVRPEENAVAAQPESGLAQAEPSGLDADRLPPSLGISASAAPDTGDTGEKPRRRRRVAAEQVEAGSAS